MPRGSGSDVFLVEADPAWPAEYARQEARVRSALGDVVVELHHAGSTSVPGLAAKPVIDMVLVVPDASDEAAYVEGLRAAGYVFRLREPEWFEHRLFWDQDPRVNLHVFGAGCEEVDRMLAFRDHLRRHEADRATYERTKRALAARSWDRVQDYADAKSEVVADIMTRALR
ncbi:GrpB family protein [Nocardioides euryhalodurans]|uniref:GrpB family protein n=2 Tax=Nocardioides euryhalodurans TaxID=2518370 RepID=A0A4V1BEG5_9ACTN|nr:GrpB family protein [Nocardioides euryhalodurans]